MFLDRQPEQERGWVYTCPFLMSCDIINKNVGSQNSKMNYLKLYCKLVRKFEYRGLTKEEAKKQGLYTESHHIFPACMFGRNAENSRLIKVSAREHYILHAVLEKAFVQRYGLTNRKTLQMTKAHLVMKKGDNKRPRYYNSRLYEGARIRYTSSIKGLNNQQVKSPLRFYFADGRVIDWYGSKAQFCEENTEYTPMGIANLQHGKGKQHIDMIKVEEIDPDNPTEPVSIIKKLKKIRPADKVPIRIYFNDGRILDYPKGKYRFCEDYPEYDRNGLLRLEKGRKNPYKDIVKVEQYDPQNPGNPQPIYGRPTKSTCHPIRIHFKDGRVIDWYDGKNEFCRQNPQYDDEAIRRVQIGKRKKHKDIIRIDVLDYTLNTPTTSSL